MTATRPMPEEKGILEFLKICSSVYSDDAVSQSIEAQRAQYDALCARFSPPLPDGLTFADSRIRDVPTRRYRPAKITTPSLLLYLHGGGFVVGSLESHHAICAELADFAGAELVAVDYRLAPEHRWPAQTDDCFAVLEALAAGGNPIVLIGDSAGGNLAAGLALQARDKGIAGIEAQVLIYPALGGDLTTGSYIEMADAPGLTTADVAYYREVLQAPAGDPVAGALAARDVRGLPPSYITGAAFDPLRDDARHYAARLAQAGIEVWFREEPHMVHAWLRARHMSEGAKQGFRAVCEAVRRFAAG
ncbi:alpha/beta hydrolase [Rhizobium sp. Rhizsp82]|uniref:alpha/beta hydrolase n=1 Tax=Rhizobium sp. Rhizsp82 TaxID=3243057 RepID=UPI0039B49745